MNKLAFLEGYMEKLITRAEDVGNRSSKTLAPRADVGYNKSVDSLSSGIVNAILGK